MTPEFRNAIFRYKAPAADDLDNNIVFQLQKLFLQLQVSCLSLSLIVKSVEGSLD